jgi:nitrite reductase (NO-forming)
MEGAMRLPKDRKDRALFGVLGVVGIATASFLGTTFLTPNFSIAFGPEAAAADFSAAAQPVYHAQIAHGPVPLAQVAVKMAKGEGPVDIVRDPAEVPPPVGTRGPERVRVELDTVEVTGKLTDGSTYRYWTFNRKVPGPFIRVRVGDTVEVHLHNEADSTMMHNVDMHAVTGPGGGAIATEAAPGATKGFVFTAIKPGLYVYHCAVPMAAQHIANGMFGMILVEPAGGLPKVDHEYYVMQSEVYTEQKLGTAGALTQSYEKLLDEKPEYFVFNGAVGGLTTDKPLHAKVGETVRIFFGNAGPNLTSSFHVVGEMFDHVYTDGSLSSAPLRDVQTTSVPPGGAAMVDLKLDVPGQYMLVDHALSRAQRGLSAYLQVTGPANPDIYDDGGAWKMAGNMRH